VEKVIIKTLSTMHLPSPNGRKGERKHEEYMKEKKKLV